MIQPGIVTLVRLRQPAKAESPMLVTLAGITTLVRSVQYKKAATPMPVTLVGIETLVRLLHSMNASSPMVRTPSGIERLVRLALRNAMSPMLVTDRLEMVFGMATSPPGPEYPVMVMVRPSALVAKSNWPCTAAGAARSSKPTRAHIVFFISCRADAPWSPFSEVFRTQEDGGSGTQGQSFSWTGRLPVLYQ